MPEPLVIIPVFNAFEYLRRCLESLAMASPESEVLVIDDASSDERVPALLKTWEAARGNRHLLKQVKNRGFVHTVNTGMMSVNGDVVLLNSDTEVTPGWLEALSACLDTVDRIATITPWTNNGEIVSFPEFCRSNPAPLDPQGIARVLQETGTADYPEIPTAVGFCMAISRTALETIGFFDEQTFGHGYGEENDFSMRARAAGLRNVLCDNAYVVHHGAASFGPLGLAPGEDSMQRLLSLHPGYMDLVSQFIRDDPLAGRRQRLAEALSDAGIALG